LGWFIRPLSGIDYGASSALWRACWHARGAGIFQADCR
jgi:hypothetical protein